MYTSIPDVLNQWQAIGVFDYLLPFIFIFAVIYGILTGTNIFSGNKGVNVLISFVIGLLALRVGFVQQFFIEIFPRTGVAIAVIVVLVILVGAFVPEKHRHGWAIALYVVGAIAFLLVVFNSFNALNWFQSDWWSSWGSLVIVILLIVGITITVAVASPKHKHRKGILQSWRDEGE